MRTDAAGLRATDRLFKNTSQHLWSNDLHRNNKIFLSACIWRKIHSSS